MTVVNLRQAGQMLGFKTPEPLRRMLKRGVLDDYRRPGADGRCVFLETDPPGLPSLRQQVQANTGFNSASPLWRREPLPETVSDEHWSNQANSFLDPAAWTGPPWTRDQWITLRNLIELAEGN